MPGPWVVTAGPCPPRAPTMSLGIKKTPVVLFLHSSGAAWESRWPSWAVRPDEPSGFRGRKAILNRASASVSACPWYVGWHRRTLSNTTYLPTFPFVTVTLKAVLPKLGRTKQKRSMSGLYLKEIHRQTDRQPDRHTCTHTHLYIYIKTHACMDVHANKKWRQGCSENVT